MRNYELIEEIKKICNEGPESGHGYSAFKNQYLNDIIAINKLIERERPELMGRGGPEETGLEEEPLRDLEETRFE
jgi:hypothetical protein